MPLYDFENIKTGEVREIFLPMNGEIIYNGERDNEKGVWQRVFSVPQLNTNGSSVKCDPYSENSFRSKTEGWKNGGTFGDLVDMSQEMSAKREEKDGVDSIKEKEMVKYEKERGGRYKHPDRKPKKFKSKNGLFEIK